MGHLNLVPHGSIIICMVTMATCQWMFFTHCPDQSVVQDFELDRYVGKWYEVEKYFAIAGLGGKCVSYNYSEIHDIKFSTIAVQNEYVDLFGNYITIDGEGEFLDPSSGEAKINFGFPNGPNSRKGNYWVLNTDYETYSLVWTCYDLKFSSIQTLRVLTRERQPRQSLLFSIRGMAKSRDLDILSLKPVLQNCPQP